MLTPRRRYCRPSSASRHCPLANFGAALTNFNAQARTRREQSAPQTPAKQTRCTEHSRSLLESSGPSPDWNTARESNPRPSGTRLRSTASQKRSPHLRHRLACAPACGLDEATPYIKSSGVLHGYRIRLTQKRTGHPSPTRMTRDDHRQIWAKPARAPRCRIVVRLPTALAVTAIVRASPRPSRPPPRPAEHLVSRPT